MRQQLYCQYGKPADTHCEPSECAFAELANALTSSNTPCDQRYRHQGVWYIEDSQSKYKLSAQQMAPFPFHALSNQHVFDLSDHQTSGGHLFVAHDGVKPSMALTGFWSGPSFADCGSVLQAAIWSAIHQRLGSRIFNDTFNSTITPFVISMILFNPIPSNAEFPRYTRGQRMAGGNPFYFLCDTIAPSSQQNIQDTDINPGDFVYILGVRDYALKHPCGVASGWNVICVGKNADQENLYLGFGPNTFPNPLTYQQLKQVLITAFMKEPSERSRARIANKNTLSSSPDLDDQTIFLKYQEFIMKEPTEDLTIGGITHVCRFNEERLNQFVALKAQIKNSTIEPSYALAANSTSSSLPQNHCVLPI